MNPVAPLTAAMSMPGRVRARGHAVKLEAAQQTSRLPEAAQQTSRLPEAAPQTSRLPEAAQQTSLLPEVEHGAIDLTDDASPYSHARTMTDALRALVAEDEPAMLSLVTRHLRELGFQVVDASDGDTAWDLAQQHTPDLVLLDVMMPGMSGWEICKRLKNHAQNGGQFTNTGVIMLTGIGENLNEMTSPLFAADGWLNKPFEFADLDARIREVLSSYDKTLPSGDAGSDRAPESSGDVDTSDDDVDDDDDDDDAEEDEDTIADDDGDDEPAAPPRAPKSGPRAASVTETVVAAAKKVVAKVGAAASKVAGVAKAAKAKVSAKPKAATKKKAAKPAAKKVASRKVAAKAGPRAAKKTGAKKVAKKAAPKRAAPKKAAKRAAKPAKRGAAKAKRSAKKR
jgi:DNA-binding response OmpR family regulator